MTHPLVYGIVEARTTTLGQRNPYGARCSAYQSLVY